MQRRSNCLSSRLQPRKLCSSVFGYNSPNFHLNVWVDMDKWYSASSDLRIAAHYALNAAGIEIARPQRDLHLRSIDEGAPMDLNSD